MRIKWLQRLCNLKILSEKEQSILKQKSRDAWLKEGDINSKYFHSIKWRRLTNEITGVEVNGDGAKNPIE